jgi:hypothetical protein
VVTVEQVRALAAGLPRTTEAFVRGCVKFRVGRLVYLAFSRDQTVMGFGFPKELREALVYSEPDKFMLPTGGDLRYNWVLVRLDAIDEREMRGLVLDAWAMCVPKRVAAAYDARIVPGAVLVDEGTGPVTDAAPIVGAAEPASAGTGAHSRGRPVGRYHPARG